MMVIATCTLDSDLDAILLSWRLGGGRLNLSVDEAASISVPALPTGKGSAWSLRFFPLAFPFSSSFSFALSFASSRARRLRAISILCCKDVVVSAVVGDFDSHATANVTHDAGPGTLCYQGLDFASPLRRALRA